MVLIVFRVSVHGVDWLHRIEFNESLSVVLTDARGWWSKPCPRCWPISGSQRVGSCPWCWQMARVWTSGSCPWCWSKLAYGLDGVCPWCWPSLERVLKEQEAEAASLPRSPQSVWAEASHVIVWTEDSCSLWVGCIIAPFSLLFCNCCPYLPVWGKVYWSIFTVYTPFFFINRSICYHVSVTWLWSLRHT